MPDEAEVEDQVKACAFQKKLLSSSRENYTLVSYGIYKTEWETFII